jgi:NAD(P)-dependent dehydrogenase (short-subunit alcohol dehydrogenase family)
MTISEMFSVRGFGVIVTGGASGIGLACAEALAEAGARVAIFDLDSKSLDEQIGRISAQGWDVRGYPLDVTDRRAVDQTFAEVAAEFGKLDVVFANAGIDPGIGFANPDGSRSEAGAIENYEDERWNRNIDVNLNGVFATIRASARSHEAGQRWEHRRHDIGCSVPERGNHRRGLHGRESRCCAPDAQRRSRACPVQHSRQRDRARVRCHEHREWLAQTGGRAEIDGRCDTDRPNWEYRRSERSRALPGVWSVRLCHRRADSD